MLKNTLLKGGALWSKFSEAAPGTHASSMSYYTFLSLVPMLAICISLVSLTGVSAQNAIEFFCSIVPDALSGIVRTLVEEAYNQSGLAISLSSLTLLWSASRSAKALRAGFNAVYSQNENRNAVQVIIISIIAVILLGALIAATMYLVFSGSVLRALSKLVPGFHEQDTVVIFVNSTATLVLGTLALTACYTFLPAGKRRFLAQLPGAVCAALATGALSYGFRIYVDHFSNYTVLYGSLATVALLLFWMYLLFYILLAGGFVNCRLAEHAKSTSRKGGR